MVKLCWSYSFPLQHQCPYNLRPNPKSKKVYEETVLRSRPNNTSRNWRRSKFYEIEVHDIDCDTQERWCKFVGYSSKWYQWIKPEDIKTIPGKIEDKILLQELTERIQLKLAVARKQAVKVQIDLPCFPEQFNRLFRRRLVDLGPRVFGRGRIRPRQHLYSLENFSDLDSLLGANWQRRVHNSRGDHTSIVRETGKCARPELVSKL